MMVAVRRRLLLLATLAFLGRFAEAEPYLDGLSRADYADLMRAADWLFRQAQRRLEIYPHDRNT